MKRRAPSVKVGPPNGGPTGKARGAPVGNKNSPRGRTGNQKGESASLIPTPNATRKKLALDAGVSEHKAKQAPAASAGRVVFTMRDGSQHSVNLVEALLKADDQRRRLFEALEAERETERLIAIAEAEIADAAVRERMAARDAAFEDLKDRPKKHGKTGGRPSERQRALELQKLVADKKAKHRSMLMADVHDDVVAEWNQSHPKAKKPLTVSAMKQSFTRLRKRPE